MSTLRNCLESLDTVRSVRVFKVSLIFFSPPTVFRSQSLGKGISSVSPFVCSVIIRTSSEFRILQIVEVDSIFLPLNISFPSILLTNVDFPALVSPYTNMHYINISITNSKIVKSKQLSQMKLLKPFRETKSCIKHTSIMFVLIACNIPRIPISSNTESIKVFHDNENMKITKTDHSNNSKIK